MVGRKQVDLTEYIGKKYGIRTIISEAPAGKQGQRRIIVLCDCGDKSEVNLGAVIQGRVTMCRKCCIKKAKYGYYKNSVTRKNE